MNKEKERRTKERKEVQAKGSKGGHMGGTANLKPASLQGHDRGAREVWITANQRRAMGGLWTRALLRKRLSTRALSLHCNVYVMNIARPKPPLVSI